MWNIVGIVLARVILLSLGDAFVADVRNLVNVKDARLDELGKVVGRFGTNRRQRDEADIAWTKQRRDDFRKRLHADVRGFFNDDDISSDTTKTVVQGLG
jgi:hypothetical protein